MSPIQTLTLKNYRQVTDPYVQLLTPAQLQLATIAARKLAAGRTLPTLQQISFQADLIPGVDPDVKRRKIPIIVIIVILIGLLAPAPAVPGSPGPSPNDAQGDMNKAAQLFSMMSAMLSQASQTAQSAIAAAG